MQFVFFIIAFWAFYPGASMELATLIAVAGAALVGVVYALYSAVYPRSGGEYVFLSRTVHPSIGFTASFVFAVVSAFATGQTAAFVSIFALAPFLAALGLQLHNSALTDLSTTISSGLPLFLISTAVVIFFAFVLARGMRTYFRIQRWLIGIAVVSLLVTLVVLMLGAFGVLSFSSNFDSLTSTGAYAAVIANGQAGADVGHSFDLGMTASFVVWPALSVLLAMTSVSFSGEVRNPLRAQLVGIVGAVIVGGLAIVVIQFLSRAAIGESFLRSGAYLAFADPGKWPLPNVWLSLLASIVANNPIMTILINLWFVILSLVLPAATMIYSSRAFLAWSLDGVAPKALGAVSEKYHSPGNAIALTAFLGVLTVAAYSFTTLFTTASALGAQALVFGVVCLAGTLFPYLKRDTYERSTAHMSIAGVPVISLAGVGGLIFTGWVIYRALVDPTVGVNTPFSTFATGALIVLGAVWFFVAHWYRTRQGVTLDSRYKEIPVE